MQRMSGDEAMYRMVILRAMMSLTSMQNSISSLIDNVQKYRVHDSLAKAASHTKSIIQFNCNSLCRKQKHFDKV